MSIHEKRRDIYALLGRQGSNPNFTPVVASHVKDQLLMTKILETPSIISLRQFFICILYI